MHRGVGMLDRAGEPAPEQQGRGGEVGRVEAGGDEADDVVECGGTADHDQTEQHADHRRDEDAADGQVDAGVDADEEAPEGDALVAGEGPEHAGGGGELGHVGEDGDEDVEDDDGGGAPGRVPLLAQDADEGVAGRVVERVVEVVQAEEDDDDDAEAEGPVEGHGDHDRTGDDDRSIFGFFGHLERGAISFSCSIRETLRVLRGLRRRFLP